MEQLIRGRVWFCIILYLSALTYFTECRNFSDAKKVEWVRNSSSILKKIFDNHDPNVAPSVPDHPVEVELMFEVLSFGEVNEVNMEFSMDIYFYQYWKDHRLDIGQDRNISITGKAVDKIWKPDTYFVNAKKPEIHEVLLANRMMNISEHGYVQYMARISLKSHCRVELRRYPFDEQQCDMGIESFSLTDDSLMYKWKDANRTVTIFDKQMAQFEFECVELLYEHPKLASPGFSDLYARFHFKRRTFYIILQIYFPSLLITLLSFVAFWIPEKAVPARVTLSVTSVLTIIYFEKAVDSRMPNIAYVKAIDYHLYASLLFIFFSLIEYALVLNIKLKPRSDTMKSSHKNDIEMHSPMLKRKLNDNMSQQQSEPSVKNRANGSRGNIVGSRESFKIEFVVDNVHIVDRISRVLFPLLYCLFAVSYWITWYAE